MLLFARKRKGRSGQAAAASGRVAAANSETVFW